MNINNIIIRRKVLVLSRREKGQRGGGDAATPDHAHGRTQIFKRGFEKN